MGQTLHENMAFAEPVGNLIMRVSILQSGKKESLHTILDPSCRG